MKKLHFKTRKGEFLIIELPDGAVNVRESMGYIIARTPNYKNYVSDRTLANPVKLHRYLETLAESEDYKDFAHKLPEDGNYNLIGLISEITEEQAKEVVKSTTYCPKYWNYNLSYFREFHALESLNSLFGSIGVLWVNPLGKEPDISATAYTDMFTILNRAGKHMRWQEAQKNVFDKSRTYLFRNV